MAAGFVDRVIVPQCTSHKQQGVERDHKTTFDPISNDLSSWMTCVRVVFKVGTVQIYLKAAQLLPTVKQLTLTPSVQYHCMYLITYKIWHQY